MNTHNPCAPPQRAAQEDGEEGIHGGDIVFLFVLGECEKKKHEGAPHQGKSILESAYRAEILPL